jgi:hypothetical protein
MIREHIQSIRATTIRSRVLLDPVLRWLEASNERVSDSKEAEEIATASDWAGQVLQLFRTIKRMERLTAFLFAGASLPEEQDNQAVSKLLATFKQIDLESHGVADPVNRPDRSESATLASDH